MDSVHVVIVPIPMHGHTTPAVLLGRRLTSMGVQSTFICPEFRIEQLQGNIKNQGIKFVPLCKDAPPKECIDAGVHDSAALVDWIVYEYLSAASCNASEFRELVRSMASKPTCIISDVPWTSQISTELGIPHVVFHASTAQDLAVSFHAKTMFDQGTFPSSKLELVSLPGIPDPVPATDIFSVTTPTLQQFYREACSLLHESAGVISSSFEGLEPAACKAIGCNRELNPNTVLFAAAGPLLDHDLDEAKGMTKDEHAVLSWLDAQAPASVIYVSFGSFAQASEEQMGEVARGIEASKFPFVWVVHHEATMPDCFQSRTQGKGLVVRTWAPQLDILSHPSVGAFVTHCGWNSVMESICCGVPMGVLPFYDEQRANARLVVERLRVGQPLCELSVCVSDDDTLDHQRIASMLHNVMNNSELRERAAKLREVARGAAQTAPSRLHQFLASLIAKYP